MIYTKYRHTQVLEDPRAHSTSSQFQKQLLVLIRLEKSKERFLAVTNRISSVLVLLYAHTTLHLRSITLPTYYQYCCIADILYTRLRKKLCIRKMQIRFVYRHLILCTSVFSCVVELTDSTCAIIGGRIALHSAAHSRIRPKWS
jgi:hypothetical protein